MFARFVRHVGQQFVGYIALFVAFGGVSYAAVALPINSVGSQQIKRGAVKNSDLGNGTVTTSKVKDGSLLSLDFKPGQLPAGAPGATGPQGPQGTPGDDFTVNTTLQSGQTEKGIYGAWGGGAGNYIQDAVNFRVPLPATIPDAKVHWDPTGGGVADPVNCPGTNLAPQAAAGHLCIYETNSGNSTFGNAFGPVTAGNDVDQLGFSIYFTVPAAGGAWSYGSWAVTAP